MDEDFFHLPPVPTTLKVHLELRISIFEKIQNRRMVYSGAWGKLIDEKTRSLKPRDTVLLRNYCAASSA
jgi:hypothetical protein